MSDFLSDIQIYFNELIESEHFMTTLVIGAVVLGLFYYYFNIYSVRNLMDTKISKEIQK